MQASQNGTKVTTGKVRGSYVKVFRPDIDDDGNKVWGLTLLVPKSDKSTIAAFEGAIEAAVEKKWGAKRPNGLYLTFRDGDDPKEGKDNDPAYKNHMFVAVKTKEPPGIVDAQRQEVLDASAFMSGDYCRCTLNAYGYDFKGKKGVSFGLNNIQVLEKGEALSSRARAEDDFDEVEMEVEEEVML